MLCENCKKNQATTYFKQTVNGKTNEIFLCSECAAKAGLSVSAPSSFGMDDFLLNLLGGRSVQPEKRVCPVCGISETEVLNSGRVGCGNCYNEFSGRLASFIEKVHGNKFHVGKRPKNLQKQEKKTAGNPLEDLKKQLDEAIRSENFEEAAVLRDRIKELGKQDGNQDK